MRAGAAAALGAMGLYVTPQEMVIVFTYCLNKVRDGCASYTHHVRVVS